MCAFFGDMLIDEITAADVERYKQERFAGQTKSKKQRSPATVNRELATLSKIFSLAFDAELINFNPCARVRRLRQAGGRIRYLTNVEAERLYEAIGDDELLAAVVTLALNTGMRRGEILNLEWKQVDFVRHAINVQNTKSGKDRVIPMNAITEKLLQTLPHTGEYVFTSERTGRAFVDLKRHWEDARTRAKLIDFKFHDLRHTAATRLADAGADAFTDCRNTWTLKPCDGQTLHARDG